MFSLNENNRYVVCLQGVDLRKGVDGLCGLIRYLSLNPANGDHNVSMTLPANLIENRTFDASKNILLPIPQSAIDKNPALEPNNPGY